MTAIQSVPDLPAELTDAIIDHLHDDKPTLSKCSLVCNSWLDSSRYHLFHTIRVRGEHKTKNFAAFLAFINDTPHIRRYIQGVIFRFTGALAARSADIRRVGPYTLSFILETLPGIRSIVLDNISWDRTLTAGPDGRAVSSWPITPPKELDTFTFSRVVTGDLRVFCVNDVRELLASFSFIRVLNILSMTLELDVGGPDVPIFPEHLQLEEMNVNSNYSRLPDAPMLDAIHHSMKRSLRRLSVACRNDEEAMVIGSILRIIGPALEELRLDHSDMMALRAFSKSCVPAVAVLS